MSQLHDLPLDILDIVKSKIDAKEHVVSLLNKLNDDDFNEVVKQGIKSEIFNNLKFLDEDDLKNEIMKNIMNDTEVKQHAISLVTLMEYDMNEVVKKAISIRKCKNYKHKERLIASYNHEFVKCLMEYNKMELKKPETKRLYKWVEVKYDCNIYSYIFKSLDAKKCKIFVYDLIGNDNCYIPSEYQILNFVISNYPAAPYFVCMKTGRLDFNYDD
jgi:hypothetical protein